MYDRYGRQDLPYPWYEIPAPGTPLRTLDFLPVMQTVLEQTQGLAATCYAASLSNEVAKQEVTQALFVLKEYLDAAVMLFERWHRTVHPGPTVQEAGEC